MKFFIIGLRAILSFIDQIIAWVIVEVYNLFKLIADVGIFSDSTFQMFNRRIYALLSIFMLFKLAFSLVTYIVNPDSFSDKSKGFGKLITNVFVSLILLVSVPTIFSVAYDLQGMLIEDNTIQKLILGVRAEQPEGNVTSGDIMAFTVYSSFMPLNPDFPGITKACQELYSTKSLDTYDANCKNVIISVLGSNSEKFFAAIANYNAGELLSADFVNAQKNDVFLFDYRPGISNICGVLVAWILLMFCIDVAIRVVKLGFLQLIAPIPIISYIDPQGSKDGMFKKWTKTCISTYVDIFVRLMAISFAIFIINIICTGEMVKLSTGKEITIAQTGILRFAFVQILIILGALLFAKQVPKLIEDLTGIKLSGTFTLNPMKRINEAPLLGKAAAFAGGAVAGAVAGHRVGSTLRGAVAGAFMGGKSVPFMGSKDGKSAFTSGANVAYKQLMGKDFVTFSPGNLLFNKNVGKKAVEEVKTPIKNAYSRLNELNTKLNVLSHNSAQEATSLTSRGVDIQKIADERKRYESAKGSLNTINASMADLDKKSAAEKARLANFKQGSQEYNDIMAKINNYDKLKAGLQQQRDEMLSRYQSIEAIDETISSIDKYQGMLNDETALRKDISKVEKAIKDLSSEKSQRERFYNYDPSPTKDVNELIAEYDPNSRQAKERAKQKEKQEQQQQNK